MKPINEWILEYDKDPNRLRVGMISQFTGEIRQLTLSIEEFNLIHSLVDWLREGPITEEGRIILSLDEATKQKIPKFYKDFYE